MAIKSKNTNKKEAQPLEGFTYEELPEKGEIEIPQELIDNSIVVDIDKNGDKTEKVDSISLPIIDNNKEENSKTKSSLLELEVPELKEKKKTKSKRRNASRKIQLGGTSVNLDLVELPELVTIDYKTYASIIKDYMYKAFLLNLMGILRDNDELTNEDMVDHLKLMFPQIFNIIVKGILDSHKMIEDIIILYQIVIDDKASEDNQQILITLNTTVKFPEHVKIYESKDFITIPV